MSHPHITQSDRDAIEDRGLVEDDHTPEMRKPVCRLCGNTGWRPGRMAVIPCDHRGVVGQLPEMRMGPVAPEPIQKIDHPYSHLKGQS